MKQKQFKQRVYISNNFKINKVKINEQKMLIKIMQRLLIRKML